MSSKFESHTLLMTNKDSTSTILVKIKNYLIK